MFNLLSYSQHACRELKYTKLKRVPTLEHAPLSDSFHEPKVLQIRKEYSSYRKMLTLRASIKYHRASPETLHYLLIP